MVKYYYTTPLALDRKDTVRELTSMDRGVLRDDLKRIEDALPQLTGAERLDALTQRKAISDRLGFVDFIPDDERGSILPPKKP